jgi:hypothetical protein
MTKEKEYRKNFRKVIWGYATVTAKNLKEAEKKFDSWDFNDEHDNESDYEWEEIEEIK